MLDIIEGQRKMIWESHYWKDPLLKSARWLRAVRLSDNTHDSTYVRIEKEIFIGFYSVRKLLETFKVSISTKKYCLKIKSFPCTGHVDYMNWHRIDKLYELDNESYETRNIKFICNQFIHSYVFIVSGENRIDGIYISSDRERNKKIYFISLEQILFIFRLVGRDYPSSLQLSRNPDTGDFAEHDC